MKLVLERFNYTNRIGQGLDGTFGRLIMPDDFIFYTCECPWEDNKPNVSCVPEGQYELVYDDSPLIKRLTNGRYTGGWELVGVNGRTECKFHPANWPHQLQGCIGVGSSYGLIRSQLAVGNSQSSFDVLMEMLGTDKTDRHELHIAPYRPGISSDLDLPVWTERETPQG